MSQHDYNIADQNGLSLQSDLNSVFSAILSNNSGATEPTVKVAYQFWADTTTGILKQRNAANTAWINKSPLTSGGDAAYITNTPANNITSTNQQAVNNELDTLKVNASDTSYYQRSNILGTASQTAGVPTGAIIERGTNANGEYVRYADGTQVCTIKVDATGQAVTSATGSLFQAGSELTWTYPAVFIAAPSPSSVVVRNDASLVMGVYHRTVGTTTTTWRIWSSVSIAAGDVKDVYLTATGRWF